MFARNGLRSFMKYFVMILILSICTQGKAQTVSESNIWTLNVIAIDVSYEYGVEPVVALFQPTQPRYGIFGTKPDAPAAVITCKDQKGQSTLSVVKSGQKYSYLFSDSWLSYDMSAIYPFDSQDICYKVMKKLVPLASPTHPVVITFNRKTKKIISFE